MRTVRYAMMLATTMALALLFVGTFTLGALWPLWAPSVGWSAESSGAGHLVGWSVPLFVAATIAFLVLLGCGEKDSTC